MATAPTAPVGDGPRLIVAVVARGEADRHVGAAIRAGAQAATVFSGRGSEAAELVGASGLALHSEKEVIVTVVDGRIAPGVARAMAQAGGSGNLPSDYVAQVPVSRVVGLLEAVALTRATQGGTGGESTQPALQAVEAGHTAQTRQEDSR
jgi:hypothetical protein